MAIDFLSICMSAAATLKAKQGTVDALLVVLLAHAAQRVLVLHYKSTCKVYSEVTALCIHTDSEPEVFGMLQMSMSPMQ